MFVRAAASSGCASPASSAITRCCRVDGEHVGALNKVFDELYEIHLASRKVKAWNRNVYYTLKYSVTALILGLIVISAIR